MPFLRCSTTQALSKWSPISERYAEKYLSILSKSPGSFPPKRASLVAPMPVRNSKGGGVSPSKYVTMLLSADRLPSRLHRPAACKIESRPASSRYTAGKSISTPASMSDVDTTRHGKPSVSLWRMAMIVAWRWAGYISVDK